MDPIRKLVDAFEQFPGIGPRQARRFVQYLLASPAAGRLELSELIQKLGAQTAQCKKCYRWFPLGGSAKSNFCGTCADTLRDTSLLFVVEKDADIENVERSGFKGLYFVLGGTVPLAAEEPGRHVRLKELLKRVEMDAKNGLREVILGLSATTEGDHTSALVQENMRAVAGAHVAVTSLGRGLSTGSELEYADPDTIHEALTNRH